MNNVEFGTSALLLKKEFLELSLEIDKDITIEMSTGFTTIPKCWTSTSMSITIEELCGLIEKLQEWKEKLNGAWICEDCKSINPALATKCTNCEAPRLENFNYLRKNHE